MVSQVADQLARYAERVAERVEPVTVDDVVNALPHRLSDDPCEPSNHSSSPLGGQGARRRRRAGVLVAAAVAVVSLGGLLVLLANDDRLGVDAGPAAPSDDGPEAPIGWHDLDPGPLAPRSGAAVTWAGSELIVVGGAPHHDGAAYDPATRTWRQIAEPPIGGPVRSVWTGSELIVVENRSTTAPVVAAAYDPAQDTWRGLPAPPDALDLAQEELLWTGSEVVLLDAAAALDPGGGQWRSLDLPAIPWGTSTAWTGDRLVIAGYGTPTLVHDLATGATLELDEPPLHGHNVAGTMVRVAALDGTVVLLDEDGRASGLDLEAATWAEEARLGSAGGPCRPRAFALADGRSAWDLCSTWWLRGADGTWSQIERPRDSWPDAHASDGTVVFEWQSNADTANDPTAPYVQFSVWVPPPPASGGGTSARVPPAECEALYGPEPWLVVFQETPPVACVVVAQHQDVQIWNKGIDETVVEWVDGRRTLPSDSSFATGRIGDVLAPGAHDVQGFPYRLPTIYLLSADESAAATRPTAVVETGMTLGEAQRAYGLDLTIDPNLMPGPECWTAVVPGDPYSPFFIATGPQTEQAVVVAILSSADQLPASDGQHVCVGQ